MSCCQSGSIAAARAGVRQVQLEIRQAPTHSADVAVAQVDLLQAGTRPEAIAADLTELSVFRVKEGDAVTISLDALPDIELSGKVLRIEEKGETKKRPCLGTVSINRNGMPVREGLTTPQPP